MSTLWQTASIFISSTFRDMHSERDILVKDVFPQIREKLIPYRIRLVDIDLRWGITADQADNDKTIECCLDSIEGCRPFFIGILGERYGWIPGSVPGEVGVRFPDAVVAPETSITAMEIISAVFSPPPVATGNTALQQLASRFYSPELPGSNALFFFRDPAFEATVPEAFRPVMSSEGPLHRAKLMQLRERIRQAPLLYPPVENYPCRYGGLSVDWDLLEEGAPAEVKTFMGHHAPQGIISPDAVPLASPVVVEWLREHATVVLDHLEEFAQRMREGIWTMLCDAFPELREPPAPEVEAGLLEDDAHWRMAEELTALFVGQNEIREAIINQSGGKLLVCTGPAGSGKSALLAQLASDWEKRHPEGKTVIHFAGATSESANPGALLNRLIRCVSRLSDQAPPSPMAADLKAHTLLTLIEAVPATESWLLAIDGADMVYAGEGLDLRWIPREIPAGVTILLTMSDDQPASAENLSQLSQCEARFIQIPLLRKEQRMELIRRMPALWAKTMDDRHVALLSDHPAANRPLFLTIALEELRRFGSYERLEKRIHRFPQQTGEEGLILLYSQMLERLERELGSDTVAQPLRLLALSKTGLTEQELHTLCEGIPAGSLAYLWRSLRSHLRETMGVMNFYHETLREAMKRRYLGDDAVQHLVHRQLADFFSRHTDPLRAVPEQLTHLHALGDTGALKEFLTQWRVFLLLRRRFAGELAVWWDRAGVTNPSEAMDEALPAQLPEYRELSAADGGIRLGFWAPVAGSKEILLCDEANAAATVPLLDADLPDMLMELIRMVEESRNRNTAAFRIALSTLAILENTYGPVHARTLEALAVTLPFIIGQLEHDDATVYMTRVLMTAMTWLPEHHPVSVSLRMQVQDFMRKNDASRSFTDDFTELMNALDSHTACDRLREAESDIPLREMQRHALKTVILTRHSQMLRLTGNIREAVAYCHKTLEYSRKTLGPFHELSIQALNNLAMILTENEGDTASGEKLLRETIALADARIGKTSYLGLVLVNNLSTSLGNAGKFEEGLPWYQEAVERKKAVLGNRHESTLHSLFNLAWCMDHLDRLEEAMALCREAITGFEHLGEGYENDLLRMQFHLAEFMNRAGMPEEAESLLGSVIDRFSALPEEKQEWLTFYLLSGYLTNLLEERGEEEELWGLWEETLEKLMPHDAARTQVQELYSRINRWLTERVERFTANSDLPGLQLTLEKLVWLHQMLMGEGHESTLHWQVELGEVLNRQERYDIAEPLLRDTMERLTQLKGAGDPETRIAASCLAKALMELGRSGEAGELMMGSIQAGAGRKSDTESVLGRLVQEKEATLGPDHPETLLTLDEVAEELMGKGRVEAAAGYMKAAMERSERSAGPLDPQTLERARRLAAVYLRMNREAEAEPVLRRVAQIVEKTKGSGDLETLQAMEQWGEALMSLGEFAEALAVYRQTVAGASICYGDEGLATLRLLSRLVRLLTRTGNEDEAGSVKVRLMTALEALTTPGAMEQVTRRYRSEAERQREERIGRALRVIKEMQQQGKLEYLGSDPGELRETAERMSESDLDAGHPEGSGEMEGWIDVLQWLGPDENALAVWSAFCEQVERLLDAQDLVHWMPRLRYCEWLMRYEGYNLMMESLTVIWQQGDINSAFVQQSGRMMFRFMAGQAPVEEAMEVAGQILQVFRENLDVRNPALHHMMHEVARYLAGKQQTSQAVALYDELIQAVSANLQEDHPFMQQIRNEREEIGNR